MVKLVDKLLLFLYSLFVFLASCALLFAAWNWIPMNTSMDAIDILYHEKVPAYTTIAVMLAVLLISLRFLYISLRRDRSQAPSIDQRTEFGDIRISLETVENLCLKVAARSRGVKDLRARVKVNQSGLEIVIRTVVDGESSIPELTEEMQGTVKGYIEEITGIPVASVTVFVANIVQSSPTFKSRVE
ncbi:alkaline shock response membrane anchor protein AmaP [Paenibacillus eucommiae]|uniref:Alkaline shock family protein YloU n=1 Tax=Paenibacillus eucommiae TaxID=1355755 RepID=A0ABS4IPU0_9BACL|nr:alkaline shock response membrane anchor protein AmaP [Paenibacillus eucommiae]MBP1989041.1 putative alkaline shock family protein YloU [Paenibacillus eucommiae]